MIYLHGLELQSEDMNLGLLRAIAVHEVARAAQGHLFCGDPLALVPWDVHKVARRAGV